MPAPIKFNTSNTDDELRRKGIYEIYCKSNGKRYVGSTIKSFRERWGEHLRMLKKKNHVNKPLESAWYKYGEENFVFSILEIVDNQKLIIDLEQKYIDSFDFKMLFNICATAGLTVNIKQSHEQIDKKSKVYIVVSPNKEVFKIKNMRKFCRENGLVSGHLSSVANRKVSHHLGWLAYHEKDFNLDLLYEDIKKITPKSYKITSPIGESYTVSNVRQFAIKHNLDSSCLFNIVKGANGRKFHKGWTMEEYSDSDLFSDITLKFKEGVN